MKVAPDVERMMWAVAESGDPQAVADFESRFPQLRYELSKRIDLVRELKASKRIGNPQGSIPAFHPPAALRTAGFSKWRWSMAAVALSALAVGSFVVTRQILTNPAPPTPMASEDLKPPETVLPQPVQETTVKRTEPEQGAPNEPGPENGLALPEDEAPVVPKWQLPHTVKFDRLGLANAIKAIGAQCGLRISMPPDMPNDEIVLDYRGMTAMEMLRDMGGQFGFTAFDQGDGSVLIIPARDENAPTHSDPGAQPIHPNVRRESSSRIGG
ncbi:MAG TPA: hypothetical protein PLX06_04640 [Fimbriimonadaceae bacterium]|nr:hypothetical protein [Fimbriimonadaceae bacterium]